jgi:sec-independent protein translocase protein TatA
MNIASLLNLGGPDLFVILLIVLLLFGAKKLPELAKGLGQAVREFSKAKDEFEREVTRPPAAEPVQRLEQQPVQPTPSTTVQETHAQDAHVADTHVQDANGDHHQMPQEHVS